MLLPLLTLALCSAPSLLRSSRRRATLPPPPMAQFASSFRRESDETIADYDAVAEEFWVGTKDHDVSQNIDALLRHLRASPAATATATAADVAADASPPAPPRFRILDVGCGPGRDVAALTALGHDVVGLDGSPRWWRDDGNERQRRTTTTDGGRCAVKERGEDALRRGGRLRGRAVFSSSSPPYVISRAARAVLWLLLRAREPTGAWGFPAAGRRRPPGHRAGQVLRDGARAHAERDGAREQSFLELDLAT